MKKITLIKKSCLAKVFHRRSVLLLFLLVNFAMQAQVTLPTFTLSVTPTPETCRNNGALAFSTTGTDPGATVTYAIYKAPNFSTALVTTTSNSQTGLSGGVYRIVATQSMVGHTSNSQTWDGNISANVSPLGFTVTKTDVTCPNSGAINVTINAGNPAAVNAYSITGPMNVGPQSSGSFTGLSGGSYVVSVTDNCGEIVTQTATLTVFTPNIEFADGSNGISSYNTERSACGFGDFRQFIKAGADSNVMVYPLQFDYIVHPPGGGADITTSKTITGPNRFGSSTEDITTSIPFYTAPFVLDLKITDACGNVFPATRNINNPAEVFAQILPADCMGSYISLGTQYMVKTLQYEVLSAPPGYTIGAPSNSNLVGGVGNPIPDGVYMIRVTDACGVFIDEEVTVSTPTPSVWVFQGIGCGAGNGTFSISQNTSTYTFVSARILAGPSGFSGSYPVDVTSRITADGYNVVFDDVAGGIYKVETTDNCGHIIPTDVTVIGYDQGTVVAAKVQKCGSFDVNLSVTGDNLVQANQNVFYWLQIKDPSSNNWGHPTAGGFSSDVPSASNAQSLINGQQQGSWTAPGTYRIVKTFTTLELYPGVANYGYGRNCFDVLSTFDYATMGLKPKDLYSFKCADGVHYNASITGYDGVEPYTYAITTKDGNPFVVNNGSSSLFTGLTGGIYNFRITDNCGNVVNSLLDIEKLGLPKLTAVNICNGSTTGKLSVDGVPYLNFSWTKDNDPTVLSTTSTLSFPTFNTATDTGTYHVRLTSSPPGSCVDVVLDYQITSNLDNPNSGADSSTAVCRSVTTLDLNTLLPATADPYGTWVETTNPSSGNLNGHLWSPSVSATGSFTFTYTVNGLCSGTSVSTYTVVNTAAPAAPTADVTEPTCTLSTGTITVLTPVVAPDITYTLTGTNPVIPAVTNATGIFSGLASGTYDLTASAGTCISAAASFTVSAQPVTPAIALFGAVTQPTCTVATGSFTITNYDATKTYNFTPSAGVSISAGGVVTAPAETYTATVTDANTGCTSAASASSTIDVQPVTPVAPTLGAVTQPTCATATGSFTITNYDATYVYTFTPNTGVSVSASGVVTAPEGNYTVTATLGACISPSASTIVNAQPVTPVQPTLGVVIQPTTCASPNGSFAITNYNAAYTYVVTPNTGVTISATGVVTAPAGDYSVTATLGACTSVASLEVTVNAAPSAPAIALFGAVTQPTCTVATGSFTITNYDATKTYTFTPNTGVSISATGVVTAPADSYTATVTDVTSGCTSAASAISTINVQPVTPVAPTLGAVTQPTCATATGSFTITNYDATYTYTFTPNTGVSISASGVVTAPEGNYTVTATLGACISPSASATVNAQPVTPVQPTLGVVTQPTTCASPNGSFAITNYNAAYTYVVSPNTGVSISGTGVVTAPAGDYSVTATLGACTSVASLEVTVNAAPSAPAIALFGAVTQPTCTVATGSFTITNYDATKTYTFTPNTGVSISATGVVTAPADSYTATVTDVTSGCTSAASAISTINVQPVTPVAPTLGAVTQPTCATATGSFTITNYDATYTYTVTPNTGVSVSATGVVTAPEGNYTVTATLGACISPSASTIVNAQPVTPAIALFGAVTQPTCSIATGSFTITNYDATKTYTFTPNTGVSISATGVVTAPTGGYTATVTDATSGCTSAASASATVNAQPVTPAIALFSAVTQPTCSTATGSFTITNYDATKTYTFTPNTGVSVSGTGVVTAPAGGYTATVTDATSGCTSAASASATVNAQPVTPAIALFSAVTQPTCSTATGSFTITNYDATYTYTFTPNAGVSISATGVVTAPAGGYTATVTDVTSGCTSAASASATVNAQPVTPVTPILGTVTQPTCAIATGSFTITNYDATYTYTFTPNTGVSVSATGVVTAPEGNYTVTATLGACTSPSANTIVNAQPVTPAQPVLSTVVQPTTCAMTAGSFTITNYDATYTYTIIPSTGVSISATGVVTAPAGDYTVSATLGACTSVTSLSTKINAAPSAPAIALFGTVTKPTCTVATGSFAITNYDATKTYTFTPSTGVSISASGVVTALAGTYTATVTDVTSGCVSSVSDDVVIQSVICAKIDDYTPMPIIGRDGGTTLSVLRNDTLNGLAIIASEVNLSEVNVPTGLTLNGDGTITIAPNTPAGIYVVTYRICEKLNSSNCDTTTATVVVVTARIDAIVDDYSATPINGKNGGTTTSVLTNDTLNGFPVVPAEVNLTGENVPTGLTLNADGTITVAPNTPTGNYVVTYRICEKLNSSNCATTTATVVVATTVIQANDDDYTATPINEKDGGTTPSVLTNDTLNGVPVIPSEVNLTEVSVPAGFTLNTDGTITVAPNTPAGNYTISYSICEKANPTNCDTATVSIVIDPSCIIEVFNAVSPNGDGENDVFKIDGLECFPDNTVEIYNRWGVLVFDQDHYNNSDRVFKGISEGRVTINQSAELPVGTYYYILKYKDNASNAHSKAGYLYLNR
ncbi:gliding motility-associated C-terminal domain-containing protein [Flavobacterium sp. PL02]|uniref:T9SS type B sorting domain-containing protein n=1 Tax=Flavobacterium sp. PL02 TaxID=3088354 RepID=UPI002B22862C|nr:gliding motility-associated C-terminal domain-containing protein [Flavobacterium sp. PL02]MEA9412831.1 gliding motility-associated C-terminal domain-containing protein [Flavobacterium sp. PL02]